MDDSVWAIHLNIYLRINRWYSCLLQLNHSDQNFTALLTLRVTALYRSVRWFAPVIWVAFALFQGLRTAMMLYSGAILFGEVTPNARRRTSG